VEDGVGGLEDGRTTSTPRFLATAMTVLTVPRSTPAVEQTRQHIGRPAKGPVAKAEGVLGAATYRQHSFWLFVCGWRGRRRIMDKVDETGGNNESRSVFVDSQQQDQGFLFTEVKGRKYVDRSPKVCWGVRCEL
jgi:hypothetical protein